MCIYVKGFLMTLHQFVLVDSPQYAMRFFVDEHLAAVEHIWQTTLKLLLNYQLVYLI